MSTPYRLPESAGAGRLIDRSKPLSFTFDGRRMTGFAGDTLASAVLANGQALFGRSFKYHRPRGLVGLGSEEPNALVGVGEGAYGPVAPTMLSDRRSPTPRALGWMLAKVTPPPAARASRRPG